MKTVSVGCGDWHLGWGFAGDDKIGKLSTQDGVTFTWKGHSQGRHGQKWNAGAKLVFTSDGEQITEIISQKGSHPRVSELLKSVNELSNKLKPVKS